jgi:acyl-coenzyme A thioesterase PaaI-like protein
MQEIETAALGFEPSSRSDYQRNQRSRASQRNGILSASPPRRVALLNSRCVVCGAENANGLRLRFETGSKGVRATWVPKRGWESFQGTVHGGIVTAVLDEAMSKAIIACGWEAFTVELGVRFRSRVSPGEELRVEGWVTKNAREGFWPRRISARTAEESVHMHGPLSWLHGASRLMSNLMSKWIADSERPPVRTKCWATSAGQPVLTHSLPHRGSSRTFSRAVSRSTLTQNTIPDHQDGGPFLVRG